MWRGRRCCGSHWAATATTMEALRGLETGEHGEGIGEIGGRCGGVGRSAHHLVVVVTVGDVGLLEKGAEGRLWEEKPKLTLSALPGPAAALLPRLFGTLCGLGPNEGER